MTSKLIREAAKRRFDAEPTKCFQRHIRELYAEQEQRQRISSLAGATVQQISREEAESLILRYEWLGTMAKATRACYGLRLGGELLGVSCFAAMGGPIRNICGSRYADKAICLARGTCVPHAPKNAASFLVRWACRQAYLDYGWQIFFAYSDSDAGEVGQIYQAVGWHFLSAGNGRVKGSSHTDWISPDGTPPVTSNQLNHDKEKKFFRSLGWTESAGNPREFMLYHGWTPVRRFAKKRYVWFEGPEAANLKARCRYAFQPYPKRVPVDAAA